MFLLLVWSSEAQINFFLKVSVVQSTDKDHIHVITIVIEKLCDTGRYSVAPDFIRQHQGRCLLHICQLLTSLSSAKPGC